VRSRYGGPGQDCFITQTRGSPYASEDYSSELRANGIMASMSQTGDCYDNAVVESFFGSLKAEHAREVYPTRPMEAAAFAE